MEQIWDTLRDEPEHVDSPAWHEGVLKEIDAKLIAPKEFKPKKAWKELIQAKFTL